MHESLRCRARLGVNGFWVNGQQSGCPAWHRAQQQAERAAAIHIPRIASGARKGWPSFGSPTCDAPIWCAASAGREARPRPSTAKPGCSSEPEKEEGPLSRT